jgi:hypothetical protein
VEDWLSDFHTFTICLCLRYNTWYIVHIIGKEYQNIEMFFIVDLLYDTSNCEISKWHKDKRVDQKACLEELR